MKRPATYVFALTLLASSAAFAGSNQDRAALHAKMNPQVARSGENRNDNRGNDRRNDHRDNGNRDNGNRGNENHDNGGAPRVEHRPEHRSDYPRVVRENRERDRDNNDHHDNDRGDHDRHDNDHRDNDHRDNGHDYRGNDHRNDHRDHDRRDDRHDNRHDTRGWGHYRNDWQNHPNYWDNRRHDRHDYAMYRFHSSFYLRPHGYSYRHWYRGDILPSYYYSRPYIVYDWRPYRLYEPPYGYHWVRVDNDIMLTAIATGVVLDVIYDIFY